VTIAIPGSSARLVVRLGTTDIDVFNDIYVEQEYGYDFAAAPRVIVDAGAYIGLSTAFFAIRYPDAKIIAIEPDGESFELLGKNTAGFTNVHIVQAALWTDSGSVSLTDPGDGAWSFRVSESDLSDAPICEVNSERSVTSVQAITVVDIMRDYGLNRIDLLKVDIEGSEKEIFANADPWIDCVDAICMELHDRFKAGCSRAFFTAVEDFPIELRRGEDVLVVRDRSRLSPLVGSAAN
jgi:FkbM family methyltransferase